MNRTLLRKSVIPVLLAASMISLALPALAAYGAVNDTDKHFIKKEGPGQMAEIDLGKMVSGKATDPEVKRLAETIVRDHSKALNEMKKVTGNIGVQIPSKMPSDHEKWMKRNEHQTGLKLDKAYVREMIKDHKDDMKVFEDEIKHGKNPALKNYANKNIAVIKKHLQMAEAVQSKLDKTAKH